LFEDYVAADGVLSIEVIEDNQVKSREAPLRNALNEVLRDEYAKDCGRRLARWNKIFAEDGVAERLYLPSRRFHRRVGEYAGHYFDIHGALISQSEFKRRSSDWLPIENKFKGLLNLNTCACRSEAALIRTRV
jgi:benzoyl-CoA 2,3-dioxygenase component B